MICVVGSHAVNEQLLKLNGCRYRKPKDMDIIAELPEVERFVTDNFVQIDETYQSAKGTKLIVKGRNIIEDANIIEAELVREPNPTAKMLQEIILSDPKTIYKNGLAYASLDVCYLLKMSHRFLRNNPFFLKTMRDIGNLRRFGAVIRPEHKKIFKAREAATYWYKHPKLNKNKANFFNGDGVNYVYDHDAIHESVKRGAKPAYSYFQSESAEVMCDMKKFFELPEQIRLNAVYEESCVLALERSIVPYNTDYEKAFVMALEKVCTSITSGKFREFAYDNYATVRKMYTPDTFTKFFNDVNENRVDKAKPLQ